MFDEKPDDFVPQRSRLQRLLLPAITVGGIAATGALAFVLLRPSGSPMARPHLEQHITRIQLPPPPPPPLLKPPPEPAKTPQEKPRQQVPTPQKASVPKATPKAPSPPAAVTTSITGSGPGSLAAGNGGGGDCLGSACGNGDGGGGDNDAYYSSVIQSQTLAALRQDEKLRFARYHLRVAVVLDGAGHIASATVESFSGSPDIEQEVRRVLLSVSTNDTPPPDVVRKTFTINITEHA